MKYLALSLLLLPLSAQASSVSLSNSPVGPQVVSFGGVLIGNNQLVRVGTFTNPADLTTFVEFGTSTTTSVGPGTSRVSGAVVNNGGETDDAQFNGRDVYLWVYNAPTASATADQGIFRATGATPAWTFPTDGGALDTVTLGMTAANVAINPIGFSGAEIIPAGGVGNPSTTNAVWKLGAIPEPTTGVLAASVLALGLMRRRR